MHGLKRIWKTLVKCTFVKKFKTMDSNIYVTTVKNYVRNECDDHLPNLSDTQDKALLNLETETKRVLPLRQNKKTQLEVVPFEVGFHQRCSLIGTLLKRILFLLLWSFQYYYLMVKATHQIHPSTVLFILMMI